MSHTESTRLSTTALSDVLSAIFYDCRTPRGFLDTPVDDAEILAAYDAMKWGPTAFNGQPLRLIMVNSQGARGELIPLVSEGNRSRVASAPQVAIVAADTNFHLNLPRISPQVADSPIFQDEDRRNSLAISQTWLQLGYLVIALRAQGLAVGPMTGFNAQAVTETILAGSGHQAIALLTIGHEDATAQRERQERLTHAEAIHWR